MFWGNNIFPAHCVKFTDVEKTFIAPVEKEQYLNGEVIQYQSATGAESSNSTCIDGKWNKTMTCDGKVTLTMSRLKGRVQPQIPDS